MTKFITPADLSPEAWATLRAMGLPENCTSATITLAGSLPIKIDCTFFAKDPGDVAALSEMTKTFALVEASADTFEA